LQKCKDIVNKLEELLKGIIGKDRNIKVSSKVDRIRKQLRKELKEPEFPQIY
jgi:hypothetical protein